MKLTLSRWIILSLLLIIASAMLAWPVSHTTAGQTPVWRVWMKVSPCSGRTDWVSVAKDNPTTGGGGAYFEIFPGSHAWATFAEAMAEANALRNSPRFASYCCREYSVWQNNQTGKTSVVQGKFGNAGFGWQFVKGDLCCEEAFALAGLPASSSCGASSNGSGHTSACFASDPGMGSTDRNEHYNWAQRQDAARLQANMSSKINALFNCPSVTNDQLASAFAEYSVIIARYVRNAACFNGDQGVVNTDYAAHKEWARTKTRSQLLSNLQWKMSAAFRCLDRNGQTSLFVDSSVATAKAPLTGNNTGNNNSGGTVGGGGNLGGGGGGGGVAGPAKLQLVEVTQDPPCKTWGNITSCNPNGGQISWYNTNYQWNSPPQQVGAEGFTITMNVSQSNPPERRVATGLGMNGGGFDLTPPNPTIPIGAPNQPMSGSLSVQVKPPKNPSGDYYLKIGVYWGPAFVYHYRAIK